MTKTEKDLVLAVDDDDLVTRLYERRLAVHDETFEVQAVHGVDAGRATLRDLVSQGRTPALLITNAGVFPRALVEFVAEARSQGVRKILVVTGGGQRNAVKDALLQAAPDKSLAKPFELELLRSMVRELLAQRPD